MSDLFTAIPITYGPILPSVPLKNLTVLEIHSIDLGKRYRQSDQNQTSLLLSFFRSSPKIEVLELGFFGAEQGQDVLSAVLGLQYLRELSIQNTDPTDCHTMRRFLLSCYGLEKVHVWFFALEDAPIPTLAQDAQEFATNRKREPILQVNTSLGAGSRLAAILAAHTRRLRHLHTRKTFLSGEEVAGLIVACHRLESFVGAIKQQDPELVISALLEHRDTLEVVDLKRIGVSKAIGLMMHSLLSACSKLKTFSAMASLANVSQEELGRLILHAVDAGRLKELEIRGLKDYFSDVELRERQEQCEQI
ncbi:MAG: hypothetical protein BYD32DRAFT_467448 [Podila humilis]|nr:MAG: hypothetical protein BYD32DRAFT_467448 [Podila humilis]